MKKLKVLFLVMTVVASSILFGCSNSNSMTDSSTILSNQSSFVAESNETKSSVDNSKEISNPIIDGEPVNFEDINFKTCVIKTLNVTPEDIITDKMCETITEIDCSGFTLETLADLAKLPNLKKLYVDNSNVSLNLKGLNKAPNLTSVTLKNCQLSEVDRLADLSNLEYLDISSSNKTRVNDYSSLAHLSNLKYLNMSWTGYNQYNRFSLTDASFINSLTNLEELHIYETGITNYSLAKLNKLKKLTITKCDVDEILKQLVSGGGIVSLEELYVYSENSENLTNEGIKQYLSKAVNLKSLSLGGDGLSSSVTSIEGLGNLKKLEYLYLNNTYAFNLPLEAYGELSNLNNLTELELTHHPYVERENTTPNHYAFLNNMISLKKLTLAAYNGMGIECFTGLKNLEKLVLVTSSVNNNEEVDISGIEKLTSLKELLYSGIRFKSTAPLDDLDYLNVRKLKFGESY